MKVLIRQFLGGKNHSWAHVGFGLAKALIQVGHQVDLFSTDGTGFLPKELQPNLIGYIIENQPNKVFGRLPDETYDMQFSYTALRNAPHFLKNGTKNRFLQWAYEWKGANSLPIGFAKNYLHCDQVLSPSTWCRDIFIDNGIPADRVKVLPHGINSLQYQQNSTISIPTEKKFKLLAVLGQTHLRKNIDGLLEAFGEAFTNKDDVCLLIRAKHKNPTAPFEVSLHQLLQNFFKRFPQHAEVKLYNDYLEDISILYRSVDAFYSLSFCEGFLMPALESLASGKVVIVPNYGGQLDFLNETNALLINGKETRAVAHAMYWQPKIYASWYQSDIKDAADKLQFAYHHFQQLNQNIEAQRPNILQQYSWNNVALQLLSWCQ